MSKKPTHYLVYVTGKGDEIDPKTNKPIEYTETMAAGWETTGGAIFFKPRLPIVFMPGDENFKVLPAKKD